jgi:hypothetical protein
MKFKPICRLCAACGLALAVVAGKNTSISTSSRR